MDSNDHMKKLLNTLSPEQKIEREEALQRFTKLGEDFAQAVNNKELRLMKEQYLIGLLERVQNELQECRVFVTTEERSHPVGCEMYDDLLNEVSEAVEAYRGGRWRVYVQARTE